MNAIPTELLAVYAEIIRNEPEVEKAGGHLLNFLLDVKVIEKAIEDAVANAKQRAGQG